MYIDQLILIGYVPLAVNGIKHFEYNIGSMEQIIIGTNGSGKSSIVRELHPLPALSQDYVKGGRKELRARHKGREYELISDFSGSGGRHTFIVDGETLNENGTAAVQTILVEQHFGITRKIFDLLVGNVRFTSMSPDQRREYIMLISGADFDFVTKFWRFIRTEMTRTDGALRHTKQKLVQFEEENALNDNELQELVIRSDKVKHELSLLMAAKSRVEKHSEAYSRELWQAINHMNGLAFDEILQLRKAGWALHDQLGHNPIVGVDGAKERVHDARSKLATADAVLSARQEDYARIQEIVENVEASGGGIEGAQARIDELEAKVNELQGKIQCFTIESSTHETYNETSSVLPDLRRLLSSMTPDPNEDYTRAKQDAVSESINEAQETLSRYKNALADVERRIERIEHARDVECPKCSYRFIPGVSDNELATLKDRREAGLKAVERVTGQLKDLRERKEAIDVARDGANELLGLMRARPLLNPLWKTIVEDMRVFKNPMGELVHVNAWVNDVAVSKELENVNRNLRDAQAAMEKLKALDVGEGAHYTDMAQALQSEISKGIELKRLAMDSVKEATGVLTYNEDVERAAVELRKVYDDIVSLAKGLIEATKAEAIDSTISHHHEWLATMTAEINRANGAQKVLDELEGSRLELTDRLEDIKILVNEMGPKTGLIAEILAELIGDMVGRINDTVDSFWTYDMVVKPCVSGREDIDYRFPLEVHGSGRPAKDVSMGSSGQQDAIDYAFKLVAMAYLDMLDWPLILDELAPAMDETHRMNILMHVSKLVQSGRCSQLFLISHYQAGHGSFVNAQYVVTNKENVTLPPKYNEHVTFK